MQKGLISAIGYMLTILVVPAFFLRRLTSAFDFQAYSYHWSTRAMAFVANMFYSYFWFFVFICGGVLYVLFLKPSQNEIRKTLHIKRLRIVLKVIAAVVLFTSVMGIYSGIYAPF